MLLVAAVRVFRTRTRLGVAVMLAVAAVFLIGPNLLLPSHNGLEMHWAWWENVVGDSYTIVTLGFVAWSVTANRPVVPWSTPPRILAPDPRRG
jgi:alpha-1,2-mannosyltransferase